MNSILNQKPNLQAKGIYFTNSLSASFNRSIEWAPSKASNSFKMLGWVITKQVRMSWRTLDSAIGPILNNTIKSSEWLHNVLNNLVDRLIDNEFGYSASLFLRWLIKDKKIPNYEMANDLVDRLIGLLKEIGTIEKDSDDAKAKYEVQLRILTVLSNLIRLTKIEDPKKLHDLVMFMIETSKNTSLFGPDAVLETLENLHRTGINCFNNETLTAEIAFLKEIRKVGPYAMKINSPWDSLVTGCTSHNAAKILISISLNESYGKILPLKEAMGWTDEVEAAKKPKTILAALLDNYTFKYF